jgi:hypothetical protein
VRRHSKRVIIQIGIFPSCDTIYLTSFLLLLLLLLFLVTHLHLTVA